MNSLILQIAARLLTPLMAVLGIYLLVRGHLAPGGGFVAAGVVGLAIVLRYYAYGPEFLERTVRLGAGSLLSIGLLTAIGTGAAGWFWGDHFFSPATLHVTLPLFGVVPLPSELLFEIGVFLTVLGLTVAVLQELGSER